MKKPRISPGERLPFFREQSSSQPTHTRTNNKNNSSVPIHLAAGKVTSAGGRVGIRERHSPRAAPTTIRRHSKTKFLLLIALALGTFTPNHQNALERSAVRCFDAFDARARTSRLSGAQTHCRSLDLNSARPRGRACACGTLAAHFFERASQRRAWICGAVLTPAITLGFACLSVDNQHKC